MNDSNPIGPEPLAMIAPVRGASGLRQGLIGCLGLLAISLMSGCISVNAPDKPIVIELNINIKQEVVYRLSGDASKTIDSNKEIF